MMMAMVVVEEEDMAAEAMVAVEEDIKLQSKYFCWYDQCRDCWEMSESLKVVRKRKRMKLKKENLVNEVIPEII